MLAYSRFAFRALATNITRIPRPYKLTYAVTYWCNYRCKTCNIWQRKPVNELKFEEIEKFFTRNNFFQWLHLTGGEPFLRKDFIDICESIVRTNKDLILLNFPTNGYLTDKIVSGVERLLRSKPRRIFITVSMDGDESLNDMIRGIPGGWKHQIETFKGLRKLPEVKVVLGMTLSSYNFDDFPRTFEAAKDVIPDLTYDDFHINIVHESEHYYGHDEEEQKRLRPDNTALIATIKDYQRRRGHAFHPVNLLEHSYLSLVPSYLMRGISPLPCQSLNASYFMDSWGNVYPCITYNKILGNIRETDYLLKPIWDDEKTRQLQKDIFNLNCPQCWTPCEAYQTVMGNMFRLPGALWRGKHADRRSRQSQHQIKQPG